MITRNALHHGMILASALALVACGGTKTGDNNTAPGAAASSAAPSAAPATGPAPGRKIVVVELHTDETGNYFKPNKLEVEQGDVIRFTLVTGVHNVHFLPDSNPGRTGLPPASDLLQLPGQTLDIPVTMPKGHYYFQCDPHSALGMRGHLEVED
ncbi:MAG TPA: plastocyanin/azurin family copper-binding protein [Gemmatimonadaceae bacterium]|nr:plastocyanin/azurin family copper-binding protein [Gemmatimonadaceae bacterium]